MRGLTVHVKEGGSAWCAHCRERVKVVQTFDPSEGQIEAESISEGTLEDSVFRHTNGTPMCVGPIPA